jgi:hypothetical protein
LAMRLFVQPGRASTLNGFNEIAGRAFLLLFWITK